MKNFNGFLGIEFGSSKQIVNEKFLEKTGIKLEPVDEQEDSFYCNGAKFAGRDSEMILLLFFDDKFCKGVVYIKSHLESKIVDLYKQIKGEINSIYYATKLDYEFYTSPYEKDDGYTESAISIGKAEFSCYWDFENSESNDNTISLRINENLEVEIAYENDNLMKQLVERNQEKNSLDY